MDLSLTNILKVTVIVIGTASIDDDGKMTFGEAERVLHIRDILRDTLTLEKNDRKVVSFSVREIPGHYSIKFKSVKQAELFMETKVMTN